MKTLLTYKGIKYLCIAAALPTTAVVTHKVDRHVAKAERHAAVRQAVAKVRREQPALHHAKREAIAATDFRAPPVLAEAAAVCVPYGGPSGGGFAGGGGGAGGFVGIGGDVIGIGHTPSPGNGITPAVPEPSGWALMILGFGLMGANMRGIRREAKREGGAA